MTDVTGSDGATDVLAAELDTAARHAATALPVAAPSQRVAAVLEGVSGRRYDSAAVVAVCDGDHLVGLATMERVFAAPGDTTIGEVMDPDPPVVAPGTDQEHAAWLVVQHGEPGLAVVDANGRFHGLIPPHRMLEILLQEHDEDLARLGGFLRSTAAARGPGLFMSGVCQRVLYRQRVPLCEKESEAPTFKGTFGYHPMLAYLDNTGEALAGLLRAGNAGANTAGDHITVLDAALTQIPDPHRHGTPILIRTDGAGCSKAFLTHIRALRESGVASQFSVGWAITDRERVAITRVPERVWATAIDTNGGVRDGAGLAEITALLPAAALADYPAATRVIVRRNAPIVARNCPCSKNATGGATPRSPPTPPPGNWPSSTPGTAPTPGSRTASGAAKTPDSADSRPATWRSTPPG